MASLGSAFDKIVRLRGNRVVLNCFRLLSNNSHENKEKLVLTEKVGKIFMIGINRPEKKNCVNPETAVELVKAFKEFESSDDLEAAVLYGKGGTFCGGYDLKALSETNDLQKLEPPKDLLEPETWRPMGPSKMVFSKPVVAAISGYAVAGGLELACMCDLRVMEESAIMGVFCRRFGVPLLDGGTVRLPKLIGLSRALDIILTGRPITGKEAHDIGLANRLVPDGTAVGEAVKLAMNITAYPRECMLADRRSAFYSAYDAATMEDAFQYELSNGSPVVLEESVQGAKRFVGGQGKHGSFELGPKPPSKL